MRLERSKSIQSAHHVAHEGQGDGSPQPPGAPPAPAAPPAAQATASAPAPDVAALASGNEASLALRELGSFPAYLVGDLPLPPVVQLRHRATGLDVWVAWHRPSHAVLRARGLIVLTPDEWIALVVSAEADRAGTILGEWLRAKRDAPHTELTISKALGGVAESPAPRRRRNVASVCRKWGLDLIGVEIP